MSTALQAADRPLLGAGDVERLRARAAEGVGRARRSGECLVAITVALAPGVDPTAVVVASRRAQEAWFCLEQPRPRPLRAGGRSGALPSSTMRRRALRAGRARSGVSCCAAATRAARRRPLAVGGFAFAHDGGSTPPWAGFEPASLHVPEAALARRGGQVRLTAAAVVAPDDDPEAVAAR